MLMRRGCWMAAALLTLVLVLMTAAGCAADEIAYGTCGENLTWSLDSEGGLTIAGSGEMTRYSGATATPWYPYRNQIVKLTIEPYVKSISPSAFSGNTALREVRVINTSSPLTIGENAFAQCSGLEKVTVSNLRRWVESSFAGAASNPLNYAEHLFLGSNEVTNLAIPYGTQRIGDYAFVWCTGLRSVSIPDSVTSIGQYAFRKCTGMTQVNLPAGLTSLGRDAFSGCESLTEITVPGSVTELGYSIFEDCTGLTSVTLESGLTSVSYSMFTGCSGLTEIVIPEGVTEIGEHAFRWCSGLRVVTLPKSLNTIGEFAFDGCTALYMVSYTGSVRGWGGVEIGIVNDPLFSAVRTYSEEDPALAGSGTCGSNVTWSLDEEGLLIVQGTGAMTEHPWTNNVYPPVRRVMIRSGVTAIADDAFSECSELTFVSLPDGVTTIGAYAFGYCRNLAEIRLPDGLTGIGRAAFYQAGVRKICIPDSVVSVDDYAFDYVYTLTELTIGDGVQTIGKQAFEGTGITTVSIPASVTQIGSCAFGSCYSLKQILVVTGNTHYASRDGVLFTRDLTELITFPGGRDADTYEIPESVTRVCSRAFDGVRLNSVFIPAGVTDIGAEAFTYCYLQNITVAGENSAYKSVDGVLFIRDGSMLVTYPHLRTEPVYRIPDGVTQIAEYALYNNGNLQEVLFPDGLKTIGSWGFWNCDQITDVFLPTGLTTLGSYAFGSCDNLRSVRIPDSVTSIGSYAFLYCGQLEEITLPAGITSVSNSLLYDCSGLKTVTLQAGVTEIQAYAFGECSGLETVYFTGTQAQWNAIRTESGNEALTAANVVCNYVPTVIVDGGTCGENIRWMLDSNGLLSLTGSGPMEETENVRAWYPHRDEVLSVRMEDGITDIGDLAFCDMENLTSVTIPDTVTAIGGSAFDCCRSLTEISLPDGITSFGDYAFGTCTGLTEITMPSGLLSIGEGAFYTCENLRGLTLPETLTDIGTGAFCDCDSLTEVTIPAGVTVLKEMVFYGCGNLARISIPEGVTEIEKHAFYECTGLTGLQLPQSLVSIGYSAFYGCDLTEITIPKNVSSIGGYAFTANSRLTSIEADADNAAFCSVDGVLFDKEMKTLVACPGARTGSYTVPDSVTRLAEAAFAACGGLTELRLPAGLTDLDYGAFAACTGLTELQLPHRVCRIGIAAFFRCTGLTSIVIPEGVTEIRKDTFKYCAALTEITLPESVTVIGDSAFGACSGLAGVRFAGTAEQWAAMAIGEGNEPLTGATVTYITLARGTCGENLTWRLYTTGTFVISGTGRMTEQGPSDPWPWDEYYEQIQNLVIEEGATDIGSWTFWGCTNLRSASFPAGLTYIGDYAFYDCTALQDISIPDTVTGIGEGAFSGCESLTEITIPGSVTDLGNQSFSFCPAVTDLVLSEGLVHIGDNAFYGCTGLTGISLPDSLRSIGTGAFLLCSGLTEVTIPAGVTSISAAPFAGCSSLTGIQVESGNLNYSALDGVLFDRDAETIIQVPAGRSGRYTIPDSVKQIGAGAFYDCSGLTDISIPAGVTGIGNSAFLGCSALTQITIPYQVNQIGIWAFSGCSSLTKIAIPEGVPQIGEYTFNNCVSLTEITLPESVTVIGNSAFSGCTGLSGVLYSGTAEQWAAIAIGENNSPLTDAIITYITIPQGTCGENLSWRLDTSKTLVISGSGDMDDYDWYQDVPWFNVYSEIRTVVAEPGVTGIGKNAFMFSPVIGQILLPDSLTRIGDFAFAYCPVRNTVKIPAGVTEIGLAAFNGCSQIPAFAVDPQNPAFASLNGVLFDKAMRKLIVCPGGRTGEYRIPDGVTEIGESAFSGCTGLTQIEIPSGVTVIGQSAFNTTGISEIVIPGGVAEIPDNAFFGCSYLTDVTLPVSVTSIGLGAFDYCDQLADVWYGGKKSAWETIIIDDLNDPLLAARIHYSYDNPEQILSLPAGLTVLGSEALAGLPLADAVRIPGTVTEIAEDAFAGTDIVILAPAGSYAETWAESHQMPCIPE